MTALDIILFILWEIFVYVAWLVLTFIIYLWEFLHIIGVLYLCYRIYHYINWHRNEVVAMPLKFFLRCARWAIPILPILGARVISS